jgi:uncharacterized membrane protein
MDDRNDQGFWRQLAGEAGGALARMFVTSITLALVGAAIGAIGGYFVGGGLGGLIGAALGAVLLGAGWVAIYMWLLD